MIIWDDSMSTGVPIVDEQHKMLFQKFNDFSEAMSKVTARETAGELLDFLQFYVKWHFEQEEEFMDEYKCPAAAENKRTHAEFINTFGQFYSQWQEGTMTPKLMSKTHLELGKWLVNHVLQVDIQLRPCVKK